MEAIDVIGLKPHRLILAGGRALAVEVGGVFNMVSDENMDINMQLGELEQLSLSELGGGMTYAEYIKKTTETLGKISSAFCEPQVLLWSQAMLLCAFLYVYFKGTNEYVAQSYKNWAQTNLNLSENLFRFLWAAATNIVSNPTLIQITKEGANFYMISADLASLRHAWNQIAGNFSLFLGLSVLLCILITQSLRITNFVSKYPAQIAAAAAIVGVTNYLA